MSKLITRIKRLALALCLATPIVSWAAEKTNPVTGEPETYANVFTGETAEWDSAEHWDTGVRPFVSGGAYSSALVDDKSASTETSIDGWNLQVGAYNGASITWSTLGKIQGDTGMWMTVDGTSSIAINGWSGGNLGQDGKTLSYYVANKDGVIWNVDLDSGWDQGLTMNYYLAGTGSVSYQKLERAAQVIKQADVALSGNTEVKSKLLVSFTSTDKTFTADAAIKIKNGDNVITTVYLTSVTDNATTLTTEDAVGTCELVQASDGVYLYWVDGDPANVVVEEKTYKPSININFTSGTDLSTGADVGIGDFAVPGTSWNNLIGNNGSLATVTGVDSTGAASTISGAKVTISGTRGYWHNDGVSAASDLRQGYIDDRNNGTDTPTVVVEGIPYYSYKLVVYFSNDKDNVNFGYITVNGDNYKGDNGSTVTCDGTSSDKWGVSSLAAWTEGGNYLVMPTIVNEDGTLTIIGHDLSGCRAGVAAIQIVEVKPDAGDDGLVIEVSGDTEYPVTEAKELKTVYITGNGTLTLTGEAKISAETINVGPSVVLNVNADRLDGTTFTGGGTVVYDTTAPVEGKGWTDSDWSGTVWIKNQAVAKFDGTKYGNAGSTIRFTGVTGYMETVTNNNTGKSTSCEQTVPFELVDDGDTLAFTYNNGWGGNLVKINTLKGTGTLKTQTAGLGEHIYIVDASGFTGVFNLTGKYVYVGGGQPEGTLPTANPNGKLEIRSGVTMTVPSSKTWTANGGFVVNGTLNVNGTLASSHATKAVSGTGTVVFGGVPSPTGDAWWKNADWDGTVEIKGATALNGDYAFNDYGNSDSTLKLTNCSGWLKPNYTCVPALEIGGTFSWNDGSSGLNNTFKVAKLKGSGTISIPNQGAATAVWQITDDWSGFTGAVVGNNTAAKRVLVFGSTLPSSVTAGEIYISEGATLNLDNSSAAWWGVGMGFVVDGTVKASSRSKWGGGTYMTLGDTGVLEVVTGSNWVNDKDTNYSNVTGTGTVRYAGTNWRSLPNGDNMFATTLSIELENDTGVVFHGGDDDGSTGTIGGLFGTKNLRTDLGGYNKVLTVKQSKDGVWSGIISAGDRLDTFIVDPGESSTGTLTLAGTHTADNKLTVNGSVNITGTWKGATTVAGTIGGTGTLTGNLTFSEGSTLKAYATDDADGLVVSGTVAYPEEGTVTVDVSAIEPEADVALLKAANLDATKFELAEGAPEGAKLEVVEGVLTLKVPVTTVTITIPSVDNTTVVAVVGEETVATEPGDYQVVAGARVVITYTVDDGYTHTGTLDYVIESAEEGSSVTPDIETAVVVAKVINFMTSAETPYTTLQAAINALKTNPNAYVVACADAAAETDIDQLFIVPGSYTLTITSTKAGYGAYTQVEDLSTTVAGLWRYGAAEVAATFTWVGTESSLWATAANWTSEDGVVTRAPNSALYTVQFPTAAEVTLSSDIAVAAMNIGAEVSITAATSTSITAGSVVLTDVDATLTLDGVPLSTTPTTTVASGVVVAEGTDPVTYSVALTVTFSLPEVEGATVASVEGATANGDGTYTAIIGDTVTVTWVANEGKVVTGGVKEFEATADTAAANIPTPDSVVDAIALDPAEMELYPNCSNYVWVVNAPEGSTYTFKFDNTHVGSGGYSSTLGWAKPYAKRPGSGTVTAYVTNNNEQVAMLVCNVTVKDVVAVVNGEEYTTAQWETAVADAIDNDQVLEVYYNVANITLPVGQTLKWKAADNRGQGKVTVLAPGATESAMYKVTSTKDTETGITTVVCTNEGAPNVEHTSADGQTVTYYATLSMSKTGTYRILRDMEVAGVSVNSKGAVTLDLNGKTLTATGSNAGVLVYPAITGTSTTLTITGGGTVNVTGTNPDGVPAVWAARTGRVIIESGTFIGYRISVYASDTATATINGGTFRSIDSSDGLLNCEDTNKGAITVTGGTFEGFNPANNGADGAGTNYVPDGYRSTETSTGVWTVTVKPSGIDPTDPTSKQEVTVEPTGDDEADKAAAEAQGTVQLLITDTTAIAAMEAIAAADPELADVQAVYNSYFKYTAAKGATEGAWEVTAEIAPAVEAEVNDSAIDELEGTDFKSAEEGAEVEIALTVKPGLYYGVVCGTDLSALGSAPVTLGLATSASKTFQVTKPTGSGTACFIKVVVSATAD